MGIQILVIALTIMLIMAFLLSNQEVLSPFFITVAMFLLSSVVAMVNEEKWGYSLSYFTVIILCTMILVFGLGAFFATAVSSRIEMKKPVKQIDRINVSTMITLLLMVVLVVFMIIAFFEVYTIAAQHGNTNGIMGMLGTARGAVLGGASKSSLLNHMASFAKAVGFIYCWILLQNIVTKKMKKSDMLYLLLILMAVIIQVLGTLSRGFFIEWIAYAMMLYFILYSKYNGWKSINLLRTLAIGGSALVLFFIFFVIIGIMSQRFGSRSILDTISFYTGLSIPSFDSFLTNHTHKTIITGSETLYGIYGVLQNLGFELPSQSRHLEFVSFSGTSGNVYTSLRRYINDYGMIGTYIIQFYLGAFYTFAYQMLKKTSNTFLLLSYAVLAHPLLMQGIDELLLSQYAALGTINLIIYMTIVYMITIYLPGRMKKQVIPLEKG